MRASATSRTNSPANIPASQAKADANKADAASPFALLVEMGTVKDPAKKDARDSGDKPANAKPAIKQNNGNPNSVKQNDAKQDDKAAAAQTAPSPAASAKPGKPDKNKDDDAVETGKGETVQSAPDDKQVAAIEQQMADQQVLPPAPVMQMPIAASATTDTDMDSGADLQIGAAAPLAAAPSSNTDVPDSEPVAAVDAPASVPAAPQIPSTAQPGENQDDESETPQTATALSVATQAAPAESKPLVAAKDVAKPAAVKTAAKNDPTATAKSDTSSIERVKSDPATTDADKSEDDTVRSAAPMKIAKDDNTHNVSLKGPAAHNGVTDNSTAKAGTDTSDVQKADASQPELRPTATDNAVASADAKPVPQPGSQSATASNGIFAINNIAAPQAGQHSQAPIATQHVQVTAQAAPNLPALAVEIAAKSQSGAKQFDIRLDPPELGRVDVRLSIDATGKASAHLSADQPQTLALLQKDAPVLARALREAGLDVSQDGLNFSLRHQSGGQSGNDSNNGRFGSSRTFSLAATASIDPTAATIAYRGVVNGRLDIRV